MADKIHHVDLIKSGRTYGSVRDPVSAASPKKFTTPSAAEVNRGFGVVTLCVCLLLIVSLMKTMLGSDPLTFAGLLETLASAPSVDMSLASFEIIPTITDWGAFQFIADFVNFFITVWNVQIYLAKGLFSVVSYLFYFVMFIFMGVF